MKKHYKYGLYAIAGIWVVAMIALAPLFFEAHRETKEVLREFDEYSASLVSQHFDEAYQHCGADFRNATPFDEFVSFHQSLETRLGRLMSVKRSGFNVQGGGTPIVWRAVIDADLVYEKKTLRFEFVYHREDGRWILFATRQL
jgi:hypothetical protein